MSASQLVLTIPGVRRCVVGDGEGQVLEAPPADPTARAVVASVTAVLEHMSQVGALLGFTTPELVTLRGEQAAWVIAYRPDASIAVELESSGTPSLGKVESTLLRNDWTAAGDWIIDDSDIEYIAPGADSATEPATQPAEAEVTWVELRHALIRGRLEEAAKLAGFEDVSRRSLHTHDHVAALGGLFEAIRSISCGDHLGGLSLLTQLEEAVRSNPTLAGASMRWVISVWSARASISCGESLDSADIHAQAAFAAAADLDTRARAVSTCLLAEVALHRKHLNRALELVRSARDLFTDLGDRHDLASSWLLEARALSAAVRDNESLRAAEQAHRHRPSWPPPLTFLTKRALCAGRLQEAEQALRPLLTEATIEPEVAAAQSLLEHVRSGTIAPHTAYEYLRLREAPPARGVIRQLEALVRAFPAVEQFQETLGWKLLNAGNYAAAAGAFEELGSKAHLAESTHSSLAQARGCVERAQSRYPQSATVLREGQSGGNELRGSHRG